MKITFDDGSFLELEPLDDGSIRFILCGIKGYLSTTMSSAELNNDQVVEITRFLLKQSDKNNT